MSNYQLLEQAEALKIFEQFPDIDSTDLTEKVNELFNPYLFFHRTREAIELWSSCCCRRGSIGNPPRTITPVEAAILYGKHNESAVCPYCGRAVTLKNVSRLGKKKNLIEFHPVIFLNAKEGDLYARCYWARKNYLDELDAPPLFMNTYAMHFSIGRSDEIHESGYGDGHFSHNILEGNYDPVHRVITEPFVDNHIYCGPHYCSYYVFGLEEIYNSDFKYCQYEQFRLKQCDHESRPLHSDLCKYLAAYSIYPRQIEMLMKSEKGARGLVSDLVIGRKKNRDIINWNAGNIRGGFRLDGNEFRAFWDSDCTVFMIGIYRKFLRKRMPVKFTTLAEIEKEFGYSEVNEFVKFCLEKAVNPEKAVRYLNHFTGPRCHGGYYSLSCAFRIWKDYTVMAETLGYDLTVSTVFMPKNLDGAHNDAQWEITRRRQREEAEKNLALQKSTAENMERRRKKYNIIHDGYLIRIAESVAEIINEGKVLVHCVGGYAERHMRGTTTILFLRTADAPDVPLYTIEMDGNRLVQIHGYRNEGIYSGKSRFAPDPRDTMRWLLDPWLKWLENGSPRREDGTPRLPRVQEVRTA